MQVESITLSEEWQQLVELRRQWLDRHLADVFAADPDRARRLSAEAAGIFLDISRQRLDTEILEALFALMRRQNFNGALTALWRGENINHTENRPALHMALRGEPGDGIGNADIERDVRDDRAALYRLVEDVRSGRWQAPNGGRFEHVVHVGIGGSHLGPALAIDVLDAAHLDVDGPEIHFVSTPDPGPLVRLMRKLPRERTLLVLVSKSFTTAETTLNGETLIDWLAAERDRSDVLNDQVVAVSANVQAMDEAGIPRAHQLHMPEWAGGRYSLWSAVGLPVALRHGIEAFGEMLSGARAMDQHFRNAEPTQNIPLLLALVGIWNINFNDAQSHAVLPYSEALARLPAYLQQLEMESNGKRVDRAGRTVDYRTAPTIWGGVGMNGQHAFFQQLHQGTGWAPMDFILVGGPDHRLQAQHRSLLANGLAQAEALMHGRGETQAREEGDGALAPYRVFPGNRPSTTILIEELDALRLGALLAMYEHKVFAQSVIWNLNPFDQFGVELGKEIAKRVEPLFAGEQGDNVDQATRQLLERLKSKSNGQD